MTATLSLGVLGADHKVTDADKPKATSPTIITSPTAVKVQDQSRLPQVVAPSSKVASPQAGEQIRWQVIGGGGGRGASTNFILNGTVGQTAVGPATSTNYKLNQGFWQSVSGGGCCVGLTGNVDCDPSNGVDISDLSRLIDYLYISFAPLCCQAAANVDGSVDGNIDISDLSALIDYLYISFTPPAACR